MLDLIWAGVAAGTSCFIRAPTAAALGAAEDVPKKLGRFCERFVGVAGSPGNGGVVVLMIPLAAGKNDVLPPSGAVSVGPRTVVGVESACPVGLKTVIAGP